MGIKGKIKFQINRELKTRVPKDLMKQVNEILAEYGGRQTLSDASGLPYNTIGDMKKSGLATKKTLHAIELGIKKISIATI